MFRYEYKIQISNMQVELKEYLVEMNKNTFRKRFLKLNALIHLFNLVHPLVFESGQLYPHLSGLLHTHWGNHDISQWFPSEATLYNVLIKPHECLQTITVTKLKQDEIHVYPYFIGYAVSLASNGRHKMFWQLITSVPLGYTCLHVGTWVSVMRHAE